MSDLELVVASLRRNFPRIPNSSVAGRPWRFPHLNVLDCVLSLNRRYDEFCLPRVEEFAANHPRMKTLSGLITLIEAYPTPLDFSVEELNYRHSSRASTILDVAKHLIVAARSLSGSTESKRLTQWARSVQAKDYKNTGISGFGLAGFQYMRMLCGAQVVKPDVHIRKFVHDALGRNVSIEESVNLLELASRKIAKPARQVDLIIWEKYAGAFRGKSAR